MKATTILVLLTTLASTTLASPVNSSPNPKPADALASREVCYHPGECGWDQSGQCEYHCDGYGGFMYMQGCGWGRKRCCCVNAS